MKTKGRTVLLCLAVLSMIAFSPVLATATEVYLEGAYDAEYLDVYIYADFTELQVISYGVRLNFDPTELAFVSASKADNSLVGGPTPYTTNATVWELGSGDNRNNPAPALVGNAVVFKGAIIDEANPGNSGVTNMERVFLGMVRFGPGTGAGGVIPAAPNLNLALAEDNGTYANFVQYTGSDPPGNVLDPDVDFRAVNVTTTPRSITMRGDASADGSLTPADMLAVRNAYYSGGALENLPAADCDGLGTITPADMICIRNKYYGNP